MKWTRLTKRREIGLSRPSWHTKCSRRTQPLCRLCAYTLPMTFLNGFLGDDSNGAQCVWVPTPKLLELPKFWHGPRAKQHSLCTLQRIACWNSISVAHGTVLLNQPGPVNDFWTVPKEIGASLNYLPRNSRHLWRRLRGLWYPLLSNREGYGPYNWRQALIALLLVDLLTFGLKSTPIRMHSSCAAATARTVHGTDAPHITSVMTTWWKPFQEKDVWIERLTKQLSTFFSSNQLLVTNGKWWKDWFRRTIRYWKFENK